MSSGENTKKSKQISAPKSKVREKSVGKGGNSQSSKLLNYLSQFNWQWVIIRLFAAYFIVCNKNILDSNISFSELDFAKKVDFGSLLLYTVIVFLILTAIKQILKKYKWYWEKSDGVILGISVIFYAVKTVIDTKNFYYSIGIAIVVIICLSFLIHNKYLDILGKMTEKPTLIIVGVLALLFIGFISLTTVVQFKVYGTSCFDMGIFSQMYYNMIHDLSMNTTCERDMLLSHFAVHCSPIFYLLLPVYFIFPTPETLLVCQAILVGSAVIPLYFICKNYKFSNIMTLIICMIYLFAPAVIMPNYYDFHENAFLPPMIMWLLWSIEKSKIPAMFVFMMLTLFVKEDAFIYVVSIGFFLLFSKKKYTINKTEKTSSYATYALIMIAGAFLYFVVVSLLMEQFGHGIMEYRYSNIMTDKDKGLFNVITTIISDPGLAISEAFTEEKILFFLQMTAPLLFLPFATKKIPHLFLLVPFFIVNLISDYKYQTMVGYQYVYGVFPLLMYASVINLKDINKKTATYIATAAVTISVMMGCLLATPKTSWTSYYFRNKDYYDGYEEVLDSIPEDSSVIASTFLVPSLSQRKEIYMLRIGDTYDFRNVDFIVVQSGIKEEDLVGLNQALDNSKYEMVNNYSDKVKIYASEDYRRENPDAF